MLTLLALMRYSNIGNVSPHLVKKLISLGFLMRELAGRLYLGRDKIIRFYDSMSNDELMMRLYDLREGDLLVVYDMTGKEILRDVIREGRKPVGVCPIDWMMWAYYGYDASLSTSGKSIGEM